MEPNEIKRLDEVVVNRIAAGEVIQKPANALKEMMENSLDAKSTFIQITVKSGGLKMLQIQDNGTGIRKDDLEIVCERFTTSKLKKFEDLSNIGTFGFRGEALASISHVAHLNIQTKTRTDNCAYKASYEDGKLKGSIKPCAGNQGTTITVEDLFYNVPQRKQVLKSPNEEFQKISDVVSKYAVHNDNVGFMLKKVGESPTIKTNANNNQVDKIKIIYGNQIAKELIEVNSDDKYLRFKLTGWITNVNYSNKKGIMLLFINHRLVESQSLKSAIDGIYSTYLPKGNYPFIYISLELEPTSVDVNVHPTKHEVHFLNEDDIIEKLKLHIESKLLGSNSTRTFYKQQRLPGASEVSEKDNSFSNSEKVYAKDLVRTDSREQKLDVFLLTPERINKIKTETNENNKSWSKSPGNEMKKTETKLTSILNMRKQIETKCSTNIRNIFKGMCFVGIADNEYALFQYDNRLYLCDTIKTSTELYYQLLIYNFEHFSEIHFKPPLSLNSLALIALDTEASGWTEEDGEKSYLADVISSRLIEKASILREYFSIRITEDGNLESLPLLLQNHKPPVCYLPQYILRLATEVEWDTEEECFESFCRETARFYAYVPHSNYTNKSHQHFVEHLLYPAFKRYLIPSNKFKKYLFELASLSNLYKVFERC